ncbi:phenyltransferase domain-containing protein [Thermodesulfobacteriota bacterium]
MKSHLQATASTVLVDAGRVARAIAGIQKAHGEIPSFDGGTTDPWDHVESAMGLTIAGFIDEARRAFRWMASIQMEDGSWFSSYKNGDPNENRKDPNMSSYLAVGLFHHLLITRDTSFVQRMWPVVEKAIDFVVSMQGSDGQVFWAKFPDGTIEERALLTGSSSMYLSIRCALAIAVRLGKSKPRWEFAVRKLGEAIRNHQDLFDQSKARYSMDWYYPILSGAVTGGRAKERIAESWDTFVVEHWGVKCVSDRPWVTMAETSELILALTAMGMHAEAERLLRWIAGCRYQSGLYWTGVTFPDSVIWPEERTTWTGASVLLAADGIYRWTEGSAVFSHEFWAGERPATRAASAKRERRGAA